MRVLLTTRGSAGHLLPLAPFGHALRRAGHEVLVVAQRQHEANVARTGLPHAPVDDPDVGEWRRRLPAFARAGIEEANVAMLTEFFGRLDTVAALPGLQALVDRWRPDLIVREGWEYASTLVADRHDIPVVRVALGLAALDAWSTRLVAPSLEPLRAELGLDPDPEGLRLAAAPMYTMMPAELEAGDAAADGARRVRQADPVLTVRESAPLPAWWPGNDDPLVYVTFGSVAGQPHMPYFPALHRAVLDALAPLPLRVLMTVGDGPDPERLGPLPGNAHVARWVPQEAVLPHAAVAVHHGGYGTTLGALAHGIPAVVLPLFSIDQWANADAVARAGAGVALTADRERRRVMDLPDAATLAPLAAAVARLELRATPARRSAERLAQAIDDLPGVDEAVAELTDLAAGSSLVTRSRA
jgi:UDP:flavonoid glycosyltransferase YjiC (YdhE family)